MVGTTVIFVDSYGRHRPALVTTCGDKNRPDTWVNLVIVSDDEAKTDQYGRQIERFTSVVHRSAQSAPGMYWQRPDEPQE